MSENENKPTERESLEPDFDTPSASIEACFESLDERVPSNVTYVVDHDINTHNHKQDE